RTISMWNLKRSGAAPGAGVPKPENYAKKEFIYKIQIASVFLVSVRVLPWALRKAGVMESLGIPATRRSREDAVNGEEAYEKGQSALESERRPYLEEVRLVIAVSMFYGTCAILMVVANKLTLQAYASPFLSLWLQSVIAVLCLLAANRAHPHLLGLSLSASPKSLLIAMYEGRKVLSAASSRECSSLSASRSVHCQLSELGLCLAL
ncbi:hypothetical protein FOZ62_004376, partial [Perkinsus olseni]